MEVALLLTVMGDQEVKSKVDGVAGRADNLAEKTEKAGKGAEKLGTSYTKAAVGLSAAAASIYGLYAQYGQLEKAQLRVAVAEKNIDTAHASFITSQEAFNGLVEKGVTAGADYEAAVLRVDAASQQLAIAQEKSQQAQDDVNESYVSFALGIAPMVTGAADGLRDAKAGLAGATRAHFAATVQATAAQAGHIASLIAHRAAAFASTVATQGLAVATRLLQIAMGPIGWALLGIGALLTAVATNAFGLRDALYSLGKAVGNAVPFLKPLLDALGYIGSSLFPDAAKQSQGLERQVSQDFASMSGSVGSGSAVTQQSLSELAKQFGDTNMVASSEMANLSSNVSVQADSIVASVSRVEAAMASIGASPASAATASSFPSSPTSAPSSDFRSVPNSLGGGVQVYDPMIGSMRASEAKAAIQRGSAASVDVSRYDRLQNTFTLKIDSVLQLDGREVARVVNDRLGMTQ